MNNPKGIDDIIEKLKLTKYRNIRASALSLGNQQRLGLAKALIHNPKLLILDEPINGLDPEGIVEVRELLIDLARSGSTIFISTRREIDKRTNKTRIIQPNNQENFSANSRQSNRYLVFEKGKLFGSTN